MNWIKRLLNPPKYAVLFTANKFYAMSRDTGSLQFTRYIWMEEGGPVYGYRRHGSQKSLRESLRLIESFKKQLAGKRSTRQEEVMIIIQNS